MAESQVLPTGGRSPNLGSSGHNSDDNAAEHHSQAPLAPGATSGGAPRAVSVRDPEKESVVEDDGRRELTQEDCMDELGYAFSTKKKWWILTIIFLVQTSMNFNTSLYSNGIVGISEEFSVSEQTARAGAALFLVTYAFGCELWAPWSEEFGRKRVLQLSLFLTNIWAIPVALAPNFATILVARSLGGLSTAGGSVTLGMIADLYDSDSQQYAVAFVVFSSVFGSVLGPIVGGFVEILPPSQAWRWCTWIQLIFGGTLQLVHLFTVPETRTTIMMDKIAKKRRANGVDPNIYGPGEMVPFRQRFSTRELLATWMRAFKMLVTEPIVMWLSLLSGFSDAIVFIQIQSLNLVYKQWGFNSWEIGLAFIPIAIGYVIAWILFIPAFKRDKRRRAANPHDEHTQFEARLYPLLWLAPCLPIGLIIFAWTSLGPPIHWIGTTFGTALVGIANYSIYLATIDYMVCAYGPYSASATGGNGLARDLLAGVLTPAAIPFYTSIDKKHGRELQWPSTILGILAIFLVAAAFFVYFRGPTFRKQSKFAQNLASSKPEFGGRRISLPPRRSSVAAAEAAEAQQHAASQSQAPEHASSAPRAVPVATRPGTQGTKTPTRPGFGTMSPRSSYMASVHATSIRHSRQGSRNASANPSRRNSEDLESGSADAGTLSEHLRAQLGGLDTIRSVTNEPRS